MSVEGGGRIAQDGSGNQTPLGGKLTRTRPRGEDSGAFQTVGLPLVPLVGDARRRERPFGYSSAR